MKNNQNNITPEIAKEITLKLLDAESKNMNERSKIISEEERIFLVENILRENNISEYEAKEASLNSKTMFNISCLSAEILDHIQMNKNVKNLAMYSREADLNDLFLAQEYLNELIGAVKEQHPDYEIDYKEEE